MLHSVQTALPLTELAVLVLCLQDGVSRVHSSRRVFDAIKRAASDVPVLHHIRFAAGTHRWGGFLSGQKGSQKGSQMGKELLATAVLVAW
jgi:hypothetical protein